MEYQDMNLPAPNLPARTRRLQESATQGLGFSLPPHVSRLNSRFTLVDAAGNQTPLPGYDPKLGVFMDMVVVDVNPVKSKIYYDPGKPYQPDHAEAPLCWSDNGQGPSSNAVQPQSSLCAPCPQNRRGSAHGLKGTPITACKDNKKFAVLVAGSAPGSLWQFTIPPGSLGNWRDFANWAGKQMCGNRQADILDYIIRVSYAPNEPNVLVFAAAGWITADIAGLQDKLLDSGATIQFIGTDDVPWTGPAPAPALTNGQGSILAPPAAQAPPPRQAAPAAAPGGFLAPSQPAPSTGPAPAAAPQFISPPTLPAAGASPSEPEKQPRRSRSKPKEDSQPAAQPATPDGMDIPDFMKRTPNPGVPQQPPANAQPQFGIQQPVAASPDIAASVAAAFGL